MHKKSNTKEEFLASPCKHFQKFDKRGFVIFEISEKEIASIKDFGPEAARKILGLPEKTAGF